MRVACWGPRRCGTQNRERRPKTYDLTPETFFFTTISASFGFSLARPKTVCPA